MAMRKRPSHKDPEPARRVKANSTGRGESSKTRPDVPSTPANKAASGKQISGQGGSGGRGRGKG